MAFIRKLFSRAQPEPGAPEAAPVCNCNAGKPCAGQVSAVTVKKPARARAGVRSISPIALGFLVALFPKCPVCWAAYMSVFGIFGASQIPYMGWMLPMLALMQGVHLTLMYRRAAQTGYGPFVCSLAGALTILAGRQFAPSAQWVLIAGILLVATGSFWNSLSARRMRSQLQH